MDDSEYAEFVDRKVKSLLAAMQVEADQETAARGLVALAAVTDLVGVICLEGCSITSLCKLCELRAALTEVEEAVWKRKGV